MDEMEQKLKAYYKNNMKKLYQVVDEIFYRMFGGVSDKDMAEFYSVAGEVLAHTVLKGRYTPAKGDFDGYLYNALKLAMIDEWKRQHRDKLCGKVEIFDEEGKAKRMPIKDISLDAPFGDSEYLTMGDVIPSPFRMEEVLEQRENCQDERIEKYLQSLSKVTREIIEMKMNQVPVFEIKKKLGLTEKEYYEYMKSARMNENIGLFTKQSNTYKEEYKMDNMIPIDVTDNYRMDKFPLGSLLDEMRDGKINKKHILQRKPFQWTERQKNKYLTRILNGQPIPEIVICEQMVNGKKKSHLIDGLQRLSYAELFRADGIVIKRDGAEFYDIPYKEYKYDHNGKVFLDKEGDALFEEKIFHVLGKRFSQFPEFLKERFHKFNINVTTYFHCTDEQIAYHIRNYNNQKGMNKSQYEFTGMHIDIANKIKDISENHPFFKDNYGKYTEKNRVKGDMDKVVVESMMAIYFLKDWKKEVKDSFSFVNAHATEEMFDSFQDSLDRLCHLVDKEGKEMFSITNSPIWFAVFDQFKKEKIPDIQFKKFIMYVKESMDELKVNGESFLSVYKSKSTRDRAVVVGKVQGLIKLMDEFLYRKGEERENATDLKAFLLENVGISKETLEKDLEFYKETLDDLEEHTIRYGSRLLEEENQLSLLGMVAYSYKEDIDLDQWMLEYARKNNTYIPDQKKNYLHMRDDLHRFLKNKKSA